MGTNLTTRREFLRLSALVGAGALIAGCPPAVAPSPDAPEPEVATDEITLDYAHWGPPWEAQANIELAAAFEAHSPNVKVRINHIPEDFYTKILTLIAGGTAPDVFYSGEAWVPKWGGTGAAMDLVPFIQLDNIDDSIWYEAGVQQLKTGAGELFGVPTYLGPYMVYYNKELFDEAGVEYPIQDVTDDWTFNECREKSLSLVKMGDDGRTDVFAHDPWTHWLQWIPTVRSFGGEVLNDDATESRLDEPPAIEAIQWLADAMLKDQVAPSPLTMTEMGQSGADLIFGQKVAMFGAGRWGAWILHDQDTGEARFDWGVAPWPSRVGSITPVLFVAFIMSSATQHPDEAWEFIKFTTATMEGQLLWTGNGLGVPILKEAAESRQYLFDYEPESNHDIYARSLDRAKALPYHDKWDRTIDTYAMEEFELVWIGEATAEEACVRLSERINRELAS